MNVLYIFLIISAILVLFFSIISNLSCVDIDTLDPVLYTNPIYW